jgi:hypothetical protein
MGAGKLIHAMTADQPPKEAMSRRKAYHYEKRYEKIFKARRIVDQSGGSCDLINDWLAVEVFQKPIPEYLKEELAQAVKSANVFRLPIAVWREKNKKDMEALVVMRLQDFKEWYL